jgi:RNA polymerase sigma-70 factor (ECF subfamily)
MARKDSALMGIEHEMVRGRDSRSASESTTSSAQSDAAKMRARRAETDEILVDQLRQGDREAFDELYRRYFKRVYGFLDKRLRNRADTEETTQEVFINIFSSVDSFRGDASFAAWVFGLTRHTLAARFRRKQHPMVPLFEDDDESVIPSIAVGASTEPTPLENYEMVERAAHFSNTLETELTPEQRQLFDLHHLQSKPIAEIARTLSKSEDAVKSNLYRTRKLLLAR